jgi:prevent-host-death family protein
MPVVGVRELKIHASEIVRRVRDERLEYVVTFHGRPVGLLIPIDKETVEAGTVSAARAAAQEAINEMLSARRREGRERTRPAPEGEDWGPYGRAAAPKPQEKPAPQPEPEARETAPAAPPAIPVPESKSEEPSTPPATPPKPEAKEPPARPRPRRNWAPWAR